MIKDDGAFRKCSVCNYEFNSALINEYNLKYCPNCGQAMVPETITLQSGGKQAKEIDEFRYISPNWLLELAKGLTAGAEKYGVDNWRSIPAIEHAWRAIRHLVKYEAGDRTEHQLVNASMRCMMAFVVDQQEEDNP